MEKKIVMGLVEPKVMKIGEVIQPISGGHRIVKENDQYIDKDLHTQFFSALEQYAMNFTLGFLLCIGNFWTEKRCNFCISHEEFNDWSSM